LKLVGKLEEAAREIEEEGEESGFVEKVEAKAEIVNKALMRISHELSNIIMTEAGRYDYDPYGYYLTGKPIPILYKSVNKMMEVKGRGDEVRLWETKILRDRKKILDALNNSIRIVELSLRVI